MKNKELSETVIDTNPFVLFGIWYKEHISTNVAAADSVSLATASSDGRVSARTVLLKGWDENGFTFFTNYKSKKGSQLIINPAAALLFYWPESGRQVRIEGIAEKISEEESEIYFKTRPRESQLSAWASKQSSVIPDRKYLEKKYVLYQDKFKDMPVSKPPDWGGYRIKPNWFEFWQNGEFRLHDRLSYTKVKNTWVISRLAP